jgi:hypothetical protein
MVETGLTALETHWETKRPRIIPRITATLVGIALIAIITFCSLGGNAEVQDECFRLELIDINGVERLYNNLCYNSRQ